MTFWEAVVHFFSDNIDVYKISTHCNAKLNKNLPNVSKRSLSVVFNEPLSSRMTSQNASFGQDEKTKHKPVSNTRSSFQSEWVKTPQPMALFGIFRLLRFRWKEHNSSFEYRITS